MSDVIDFASKKRDKDAQKTEEETFEEIMRRNADNAERVRRERKRKNDAIKRDFGLNKPKPPSA